jgi:hypothetical protein
MCIECTGGTLFRVQREEVSRRDTCRVVEHSVSFARCASSRRMPGGREAFLSKKYLESELFKISGAPGVCESGLVLSP